MKTLSLLHPCTWPPFALVVIAMYVASGCKLTEGSFDQPASSDGGPPDATAFAPDVRPPIPDASVFEAQPITSLAGPLNTIGCADGTREGFLDSSRGGWPAIAGCSGAWDQPGLSFDLARILRCERLAGNNGMRASGRGCGAADLCAAGWHVCRGPIEVDRLSPSQCESVVGAGVSAFFAVAGGGSVGGDCAFGQNWVNDVRGCGTIGQAESEGCYPLDRRLDFTDCLASRGAWACGGAAQHDKEVVNVFKPTADLGGVLCCRDES